MKIVKRIPKNKAISTKITETQDEKLIKLSQKYGITKSNLINQLLEVGFKQITRSKTF